MVSRSNHSYRIDEAIKRISSRFSANIGFAMSDEDPSFRPDATAWAVMALAEHPEMVEPVRLSCQRLAEGQAADGSVALSASLDGAVWPTPLTMLAWKKAGGFDTEIHRAAEFLLSTSGKHWKRRKGAISGHDTEIRGWPWIAHTHSWVEPTAMCIIALTVCGHGDHPRVLEAVQMIRNRQLPKGGWNYGNTYVFGNELLPTHESTGFALCALRGRGPIGDVEKSVYYLESAIHQIRTPLTLSWGLFGLKTWQRRLSSPMTWIIESLERQDRYGAYQTDLIAQLLVAWFFEGHFWRLFDEI